MVLSFFCRNARNAFVDAHSGLPQWGGSRNRVAAVHDRIVAVALTDATVIVHPRGARTITVRS